MSKIKVGDCAPSFRFTTPAGESVELDTFWKNGRFLHVIFLRHLG